MQNRKLVLSGISLTTARPNRYDIQAMQDLSSELEPIMISSGFLREAPFKWIGLSIRYGLTNDDKPVYQGINKKHGDLSLAIEVDTHELQNADLKDIKRIFGVATLKALIHAGEKYKLPTEALIAHRDKFYPNS